MSKKEDAVNAKKEKQGGPAIEPRSSTRAIEMQL